MDDANPRTSVLFIVPSLAAGGAERVVATLLRHLSRQKISLTLAVVNMRTAFFLEDLPHDLRIIDLKCSRVRYALPKIVYLIRDTRPEVVFTTLGYLNLALAILRPLLPDSIRYIARESSIVSKAIQFNTFPTLWTFAYRRFYSRFDKIVCQSHFMASDLAINFRIPADKITVINNPLDSQRTSELAAHELPKMVLDYWFAGENTITLVAVGRLVPVKGFDMLIRAVAMCSELPIKLLILGDGRCRGELEELSRALQTDDRIRFLGFQRNPYQFLARANAFVLSSHYEGFPNVLLEALACGTPVISMPAIGGVAEILDRVAECVTADAIDPESLARAIRKWASGTRRRVSHEAIEPYLLENIIGRYENILLAG